MKRVRVQHQNREYHLGYFTTHKEVNAAKEAARRVLDAVEADKPAPTPPKPPSLTHVARLVNMGVFDTEPSLMLTLSHSLVRRYEMLKANKGRGLFPLSFLQRSF